MKKRLIFFITIFFTMFVLIGCSSSDTTEDAGGEEVTLDIFNIKVETSKQLEDLAEKYENENPNVSVNVTTVGGGQDASSALQAKFSSGEEPAIFMLSGLSDVEKYQNTLLDLSDLEAAKTASEGTLEGVTVDGIPYGVPTSVEGFGWMINKEIFKQAGIDPENINTFDDFVNAVQVLEDNKEELGLEAVFAFTGKEFWVISQFSSHFSSPEFNNSLNDAYNSESINYEYGDRMKEYVDLIIEHSIQPVLSLDYSTGVEELFMNEKVAMVHQGNWIVPTLDSMDPEFSKEKLGILPFFVESDTEGKISVGPPWYWGINKSHDEAVVEEAKKFLDWMYTSEEGKRALVEDFKYIPAHEGFDLDSITDPVSKEVYQYLNEGKNTVWAHNNYPDGWSAVELFPEFQKYLAGDISWDEFKENTQKTFEDMR